MESAVFLQDRIQPDSRKRYYFFRMKTNRYLGLIGLAVLSAACSEIQKENNGADAPAVRTSKVINTKSSDAQNQSNVLVKFETVPDSDALASLQEKSGILSVEPLFTQFPGKEVLSHKCGLDRWYQVAFEADADIDALVADMSALSCVQTIQYNIQYKRASDCKTYPYIPEEHAHLMASSAAFNDPSLPDQWHYKNTGDKSVANSVYKGADINVEDVWKTLTTGDNSIIVAVVDEGVKYTHPDLAANMWKNSKEIPGNGIDDDGNGYVDDVYGYNFYDNGAISWASPNDSGHGTHCAGTIAAVNNNGVGVSGVAGGSGNNDGVRIMSCQVFSNDNGGSSAHLSKAFKYAADMGASIASCSLGYDAGTFSSDADFKNRCAEYDAIRYFEASKNNDVLDGGIVIFAAGNEAYNTSAYPGGLTECISVSAFGPDYLPAYYTNYGAGCNISAPGGEAYLAPWTSYNAMVLSTLPSEVSEDGSDYGYMQGTSMACPHVSGVVALGLSYAKKLGKTFTLQEFKSLILASANDFETRLASASKDYVSGAGISVIPLGNYRKKMGTGSIDAWKLMMNIEGTPCIIAEVGKNQWLSLSDYFGTSSASLTYTGVEVSTEAITALGLKQTPYIEYGRLWVYPTKCGSAKITVKAVGGGENLGTDDKMGGMEISREVSVIVKTHKSDNGGWL